MKRRYALFVCFAFFVMQKLSAQPESDAGLWTTVSIEKELTSKFSLGLDEEFRLRNNFTSLNLFYTNIGASWKPLQWLKLGLTYRAIEKWKYEYRYFSFRHRLMFDASCKLKAASWRFAYRSRVQSELRDIYSSEKGKIPEWFWRNKFDIKYSAGKMEPYAGCELRYQVVDPREPEGDGGWHRVRIYAGVDYEINKKNTVSAYYLIQREFNIPNPAYLYIVGLQYAIVL